MAGAPIDLDQAIGRVLAHAEPPGTEQVPLHRTLGRTLAETEAPIWKREVEGAGAHWVEGVAAPLAEGRR